MKSFICSNRSYVSLNSSSTTSFIIFIIRLIVFIKRTFTNFQRHGSRGLHCNLLLLRHSKSSIVLNFSRAVINFILWQPFVILMSVIISFTISFVISLKKSKSVCPSASISHQYSYISADVPMLCSTNNSHILFSMVLCADYKDLSSRGRRQTPLFLAYAQSLLATPVNGAL